MAHQYQRAGFAGVDLSTPAPDYSTLLTIASEMILVPYFLVGAFLLKIARRPLHKAVDCRRLHLRMAYGYVYASGPVHLLLSVILYAPGLLVFLYARRTHRHDRPLKRRDLAVGFCWLPPYRQRGCW